MEANTLVGLLGEGFHKVSTQAALSFLKQYDGSTKFYAIRGGNDKLPQAFAERLKDEIHFNCTVKKVEEVKGRCILQTNSITVEAPKVIFACPLPAMKKIKITPPLSILKQQAMRETPYTACTRISIIAPPQILAPQPRGGVFYFSNDSGWYREQTAFQEDPQQQTVFNTSLVGAQARKISKIPESERTKIVNEVLTKISHTWDANQATLDTHTWEDGGYVYFQPGKWNQQKDLAKAEGSYHFAGEHTSPEFASMNGAIKSGIRAADEILAEMFQL